ncbi:hypothetical protein C8R44DRAFT_894310 [Mycena epipterygia]|nr:hypothetical protein C8R44DRAFT_894310 [Mycena epipterygia]
MRDFPQELIEKVIDSWRSVDQQGMKPSGLVCKRWRHRSRYHLFSKVYLDAENLCGFTNLVDTSSFPILAFIQHLRLTFTSFDGADLARLHDCPHLTFVQICSQKGVGPNRLELDWLDSHESLQTHFRAWDANSVSITHLVLDFPRRDLPLRTVIDLISCVPALKNLSISGASRLLEDTALHRSTGRIHLANLHISAMQRLPLFFFWLLSLPVPPTIQNLIIPGLLTRNDTVELVEGYLECAGGRLQMLGVGLVTSANRALLTLILRRTPNIQSFMFTCRNPCDLFDYYSLALPASCKEIFVHVLELGPGDTHWSALDAMLAEPRFRAVKRFYVNVLGASDKRSSHFRIRRLMPFAAARGILK